ncbi:MAG: hypothetical protein ACUVSQ_06430 [Pseudanabaenaceae cyanobacterium]
MRYTKLTSIAIAAAVLASACTTAENIAQLDCTVENIETREFVVVKAASVEDCENKKQLAKQGQLPELKAPPAAPAPNVVPRAATPTAEEPFAEPTIPASPLAASLIVTPGVKERKQEALARVESAGNRNPFMVSPGVVPKPSLPSPVPAPPRMNPPMTRPGGVVPTGVRVSPPLPPSPPPPPPPRTAEAGSILVNGIVELGRRQFAIVAVPGETTSRYVATGQRLFNNQVLVKRIETAGIPTVILEQNGVEVPRPVGEAAVAQEAPADPANPGAGTSDTMSPNNPNSPPGAESSPPSAGVNTPVPATLRPLVTPQGVPTPPTLPTFP